MIELMKHYNYCLQRLSDANKYFDREDISIMEKQNQGYNTAVLMADLKTTFELIQQGGYPASEHEMKIGFTQVKYLVDKGLI